MPTADVRWSASFRLIPSRFPPASLYDRVADPSELEVAFAFEVLTNPRVRQELGELSLVPREQRLAGPGTTPIMAAFTHLNPEGSRFSDGTWGVYYAGESLETAVAEVSHHRERFLARTEEPAIDIDMRCYRVEVFAHLDDVRGDLAPAGVMDPNNYGASQAFARRQRDAGSKGVIYDSVRHPGGECVALFNPRAAVPPARQTEHITLCWNGERIDRWYRKSDERRV